MLVATFSCKNAMQTQVPWSDKAQCFLLLLVEHVLTAKRLHEEGRVPLNALLPMSICDTCSKKLPFARMISNMRQATGNAKGVHGTTPAVV